MQGFHAAASKCGLHSCKSCMPQLRLGDCWGNNWWNWWGKKQQQGICKIEVVMGSSWWLREEQKPVATCVMGRGLPQVAKSQPGPVPSKPIPITHTGFSDLWQSLIVQCQALSRCDPVVIGGSQSGCVVGVWGGGLQFRHGGSWGDLRVLIFHSSFPFLSYYS